MGDRGQEQPKLGDAVEYALEEARMILPGIQALFGFQLVAVFNQRFNEVFDGFQQGLHLAALALVALAMALAMTPAAYHRQVERGRISERLLRVASSFIGWAMAPLMCAVSIDLGLIAYVVTGTDAAAIALGGGCLAVFTALWVVFPQWVRRSEAKAR